MMARVFVPYALRKYADGAEEVDMPADTLGELIENLEAAYPGMKRHLEELEKLAEAADSGDMAAVGAAMGNLGQACGGCHKPFRKPKG